MPIRSPRGRAAAYRALWQWPLRSPARLAVTVVAVLAVVLGVSTGLTALNPPSENTAAMRDTPTTSSRSQADDESGTPSRTTTSPSTPAPTALPPVDELRPSTRPLASAPAAALDVAARWSSAWVRPPQGTTTTQWIEGLRPSTTQEYLGVLATVDPVAIPATRVTGVPRPVKVAPNSVEAEVPTDALTLLVLVVLTEDGDWRVSGYDRL